MTDGKSPDERRYYKTSLVGNIVLRVVLNLGISHIRIFMSNNIAIIKKRENLVPTRIITMTVLPVAISFVLAFLEFPVPLSRSFALFFFPCLKHLCRWIS